MSALADELLRWHYDGEARNIEGRELPITREEIRELQCLPFTTYGGPRVLVGSEPSWMEHRLFITPFAKEMRTIQLKALPVRVAQSVDLAFLSTAEFKSSQSGEDFGRRMGYELCARVCADTEVIEVDVEVEGKKHRVKLEAKVLYPKLNISLPHNSHHVQFRVWDGNENRFIDPVRSPRQWQEDIQKQQEINGLDELLNEITARKKTE